MPEQSWGELLPVTRSPDPAHLRHGCSPSPTGVVTAGKCVASACPPISHEEPSVTAALCVTVSFSSPLCRGVLECATGSRVLSWAQGSDRGQASATVTGAPRGPTKGHAHSCPPSMPGDPQGPEVPWEGQMVRHRGSPQRFLGWAPSSSLCPAHKHCGDTLFSPGPVGTLWGCPVSPSPMLGCPMSPGLVLPRLPTQPSSTAHLGWGHTRVTLHATGRARHIHPALGWGH